MRKSIAVTVSFLVILSLSLSADVIITMVFDDNASPRGFVIDGTAADATWSGGYTGTDDDFNSLDNISSSCSFSVSGLSIGVFSGTMTPGGGTFQINGNGGGIGTSGFNDESEYWTFSFSHNILLTAATYYGDNSDQQTILVDGIAVAGSPFDSDFAGESIKVDADQTLTFGYNEAGENGYNLSDITIAASTASVPEPASIMLLFAGVAVLLSSRSSHRRSVRTT